jgi:uncharacterized protein (DUF924 family)
MEYQDIIDFWFSESVRKNWWKKDELARKLRHEAIKSGDDKQLTPPQRSFLYMPLMHSESVEDHEEALKQYASHPEL